MSPHMEADEAAPPCRQGLTPVDHARANAAAIRRQSAANRERKAAGAAVMVAPRARSAPVGVRSSGYASPAYSPGCAPAMLNPTIPFLAMVCARQRAWQRLCQPGVLPRARPCYARTLSYAFPPCTTPAYLLCDTVKQPAESLQLNVLLFATCGKAGTRPTRWRKTRPKKTLTATTAARAPTLAHA